MIEIERKFDLSDWDYSKIKEKCNFISNKLIIDKFFDTSDFQLFAQKIKFRERNWELQLKMKISNNTDKFSKSIEITELWEVKSKLLELKIVYEDTLKVLEISTQVEKFNYSYKWYNFTIDVQKYKYNNRYEIELELDEDIQENPEELINGFRSELWLFSIEQLSTQTKVITCAKNENPALYEVIMKTKTV
jgi:uncharacterized protein YjbK